MFYSQRFFVTLHSKSNEMKNLLHIILLAALASVLFACKQKVKPVSGELTEDQIKPKNDTIQEDTIVNEWGEPSPPPAPEGDGSGLFTERLAKRAEENMQLMEEENSPEIRPETTNSSDNPERPAAESSEERTPANQSRPNRSEPSKPQAWSPSSDMTYDYNSYSSSGTTTVTSNSGVDILPYAANDAEKIDFLKNFYNDCFARDGRNVDETMMSVACRRYIQDKVAETGDYATGRFFRTQRARGTKTWAEVQKNMTIKSTGEDWFRVEMDEGSGKRFLDVKVVEVDGQLKIDMVKNKNI